MSSQGYRGILLLFYHENRYNRRYEEYDNNLFTHRTKIIHS